MKNIYMIRAASTKALGLIPCDLSYFRDNFIGNIMPSDWQPPECVIHGKSYPVKDFVGWMLSAPVISEKALCVLRPLIEPYVQIFYLATIKSKRVYALNVTEIVDCLDIDRSSVSYLADNQIDHIDTAIFKESNVSDMPAIFKLPQNKSMAFVTREFVQVVLDNKLQGAHFVDPADGMWFIKPPEESGIVS